MYYDYQVISYIGKDPTVIQNYKSILWANKAYFKRIESGVYDTVQIWLLDGQKRDALILNWAKNK